VGFLFVGDMQQPKSKIVSPASPLTIKNVVALFQLSLIPIHLDLEYVTYHVEGRCDPSIFPAVVGTVKETNTRFNICSSGKVILTGAANPRIAQLTAYLLCRHLSQLYPQFKLSVYNLYFPNSTFILHASNRHRTAIADMIRRLILVCFYRVDVCRCSCSMLFPWSCRRYE